jgi:hypothetical protein
MKKKILIILLLIGFISYAQDTNYTWPRYIEAGTNFTISLYQPQLETLEGNLLKGRMALSVKDNKDASKKLIFGALWFEARISTDLEDRTAVLESVSIQKVKFPDIENEDNIKRLKSIIIDDFMDTKIEMSLDNIIANLESVATDDQSDDSLSHEAPAIFLRKEPTVLVSIDGDPIFKKDESGKLEYVVNTPFFIVKKNNTHYLKGENSWYKSNVLISNDWESVGSVPKDVKKLADKNFDKPSKDNTSDTDNSIPKIIVVTKPSELIVTTGEIAYKPINETSLLYVNNTESDIILEIETQTHFVLINGRWYNTKSLNDNEWQFVEPDKIPESFKTIPADAESISSVRISIPGTDESKEAMYEQYIPQTAVVDKKTATTEVTYDGEPKFEKIENTNLEYAVNTQSTVVRRANVYYVVDDGVWFKSNSVNGPWSVAESRPEEVKDIPASSPVYNIKYVYVYDSTPDVVYVGYTPGYYHSYVYNGVVVYGTGYYYYPWYGANYYPRPVTYGFGVHYNPYTGWGFSVGVSYGWMTLSFHSGGYWGPAGYRHGYRHGYHNGYHHGYHNGYAAGYARGRYDSNNVYRRSDGQRRDGIATRRENTSGKKLRSTPTNRADGSNINRNNRNRNDVLTDKTGNVYQRDNKGNWQEKRNNTRSNVNSNRGNTSTINRTNQRNQLNQQYNNRVRGNTNTRNFNSNRSSRGTRSFSRRRG